MRTGGLPPPLGEVTTYDYDTWGRLGEVTDPEGLPTTYSYDSLDRTISRTDALGEAAYFYAGDSQEMVSEQVTLAGAGGITSRKVALSPEGPLAIQSTDAVGATVTRYPLTDPHGDVIALFRNVQDLTGTRTYSPWGEVRASTGDAPVSPFGFQGDWTDPGTGQVDMGARMYEPDLGRFTTMDPLFGQTTNPLSLNRFTYGLNSPLRYTDPTGLSPIGGGGCPSPCGTTRAERNSSSTGGCADAIECGITLPYQPPKPEPRVLQLRAANRLAQGILDSFQALAQGAITLREATGLIANLLARSDDPGVRSLAARLLPKLGSLTKFVHSSDLRLLSKLLIPLDLLLTFSKHQQEGQSGFESGARAALEIGGSAGGGAVATNICLGLIAATVGAATLLCGAGAITLTVFGRALGDFVADRVFSPRTTYECACYVVEIPPPPPPEEIY